MTQTEARDIITVAFLNQWPSQIPIAMDNENLIPPVDDAPFVQFSVRFVAGAQTTFGSQGNRRFRREGTVAALVHVPCNTATARASDLATLALNIFEGKEMSGISFFNGTIREIGPVGKYFVVAMTTDYSYDEIK